MEWALGGATLAVSILCILLYLRCMGLWKKVRVLEYGKLENKRLDFENAKLRGIISENNAKIAELRERLFSKLSTDELADRWNGLLQENGDTPSGDPSSDGGAS
jgi:hypothetical protein